MTDLKLHISYWSEEKAHPDPEKKEVMPQGWYCWVHPSDSDQFREWMGKNCPTTMITMRRNTVTASHSYGPPMFQTFISDAKEATIFQLRWM